MGKVCVLGIFAADAVWRSARMPRPGETILSDGFMLGPGGKGSNQAVAAARAGAETTFLTRLGDDPFADMAERVWGEAGVEGLAERDGSSHTASAFIHVAPDGMNAIIVAPGAAGLISPAHVERHRAAIEGADLFVTQLEQPVQAAEAALRIARGAGVRTILNPAPAADLPDAMLALCDIVTPNESETEALCGVRPTGPEDAAEGARALVARGAGAAVITLGGAGAFYLGPEGEMHVPARPAGPVVDTTGAGDAFNGGLATALAEGRDVRDALRFAAALAGISVTREGAASSMPTRAEIDAALG